MEKFFLEIPVEFPKALLKEFLKELLNNSLLHETSAGIPKGIRGHCHKNFLEIWEKFPRWLHENFSNELLEEILRQLLEIISIVSCKDFVKEIIGGILEETRGRIVERISVRISKDSSGVIPEFLEEFPKICPGKIPEGTSRIIA